jgi:ferric enterobactin receptor
VRADLQQLQGSMIERVEIITNPSARYEAEGMGGVINIVLKKERKEGINGSFDIITGHPTNYGAAANVNYRRKNLNFFINYTCLTGTRRAKICIPGAVSQRFYLHYGTGHAQ